MGGILEEISARLARIEARLAKCDGPNVTGWVPPSKSPLGPKAHCAAARRLRDAGDPRAYVKGKKHLIAPEAVRELMLEQMSSAAGKPANSVEDDAFFADLMKEVGGN